ncbi:MAG: hypothetical protein M3071_22445, partial [Actinomycetota bacterium]|nr:hypothetical protein [Actinomycetota bacterium]
ANAAARPTARRKSQTGRASPPAEPERDKGPDLARELEAAAAERARLAAERDALLAERDELRVDRDALRIERDGLRRQQARARKKVTELQGEMTALEASANVGLSEARDMLAAERAETSRLRMALESREVDPGDHDRLARELETLVAERDRLAEQASQVRAVRPEAVGGPVRRPLPARSARRAPVWVARLFALTAMIAVLLTLALVSHVA